MIINQVIYTAANEETRPINGLHGRGGYRVIAITTDLKDEKNLLEFLENWHYPLGCQYKNLWETHPKFKSLLFFKNWVIYTIAEDVGIGHDGRSGTIYTQHMILTKEQFLKLDNDTGYLDPYYTEYPHSTRYVPPLPIQKGLKPVNHINHKWIEITDALKKKKNVAIESSRGIPDMQGMIRELPIEDRLIPWCNIMYEPDRQWLFKFFCSEEDMSWKLQKKKNWMFFNLDVL